MKRMLCSLVLLVTMSTMGLLVESKSASAGPITFTELEPALQSSEWEGTWEEHEYFNSGPAKLFLTIMGADVVYVEFQMFDTGMGDYTFDVSGTINGNTMTLTTRRSKAVLRLYKKNGVLELRGDYDVFGGEYAGETGTYYFKIKKE